MSTEEVVVSLLIGLVGLAVILYFKLFSSANSSKNQGVKTLPFENTQSFLSYYDRFMDTKPKEGTVTVGVIENVVPNDDLFGIWVDVVTNDGMSKALAYQNIMKVKLENGDEVKVKQGVELETIGLIPGELVNFEFYLSLDDYDVNLDPSVNLEWLGLIYGTIKPTLMIDEAGRTEFQPKVKFKVKPAFA